MGTGRVWREAWMSRRLLTRGPISLPVPDTGTSLLPLALSKIFSLTIANRLAFVLRRVDLQTKIYLS